MDAMDDLLATRRSKRSTAGNRMEAALAEMALDMGGQEIDDDNDFIDDKDEEDVFESDFESTDEEADADAPDAGDKDVGDEERRLRKIARARLEKATAAAHAKHKVTFNPTASCDKSKIKPRPRIIIGPTTAEAGEHDAGKKRSSQRMHTVLNSSATFSRMKESERRRAAIPKKAKIVVRSHTQAELIALALDNEEGNIVEHRDYLKVEEEKRKRARVVRAVVQGQALRWLSKAERVQVAISPQTPDGLAVLTPSRLEFSNISQPHTPMTAPEESAPVLETTSEVPVATTEEPPAPPAVPLSPPPEVRFETVNKNYIVHELGQLDTTPKPRWIDTMNAMFGNHVLWDEIKVYVGKGRPLSRPKQMCAITGKEALYLDPRTGVPFADARAFKVLSRILEHEYIWDPTLGCYLSGGSTVLAT